MGIVKSKLLKQLSQSYPNFLKKDLEKFSEIIFKEIKNTLKRGERVELRGFGTFGVKHRMPKKARNPGTGDAIYLPERYVPTFKPSKIMRSRVNELTKKQ